MTINIQIRGDNSSNWTSVNPLLADREIAYDKDRMQLKIGDATNSWNALPFYGVGTGFTGTNASATINSNGIQLSAAAGGGGGGGAALQGSGTYTQNTGTVQFSNSGGVTFGLTAGVMTATVATNYMASNQSSNFQFTSATSAITSNAFPSANTTKFAGTGYTSTTQAGSTVGVTQNTAGLSAAWPPFLTTSPAQTNQTVASGNIAGTGFSSTSTGGVLVVGTNNTAGLSLGVPNFITTYVNDLTSGRAGTGYTSTTQAGSTVGMTLNTSGLSAAWPPFLTTYVAQTVDTNKAGTGFTTGATAGVLLVGTNNTNGLSMGVPAFITTYVNDLTSGRAGTGTTFAGTNISGSMTHDTNGLNLALSVAAPGGAGTTSYYNNFAVPGSTITSGTVVFSNSNNVSFGINGSTVTATASYAAQTVDTNKVNTGYTSTTQGGSTVGVTANSSGLSMAWPPFLTTAELSANSSNYINTSQSSAIDWTSAQTNYLQWGNSSTTYAGTNASLTMASNGLSISAAGGGGGYTGYWFQPEVYGNSMTQAHGNGTVYLRPIELDGAYDVDRYLFQQSLQGSGNFGLSASVSGGSASSGTASWGQSGTVIIFTRANTNETHASYNSIQSYLSNSYSMSAGASASCSWSTNVSSATCSWTTSGAFGWIKGIDGIGGVTSGSTGTSGSSTFSSTSNAANSFSSSWATNSSDPAGFMQGMRPLFVPGGGNSLSAGEYWLGLINSTTSGTTNMSSLSRLVAMTSGGMLYYTASSTPYLEYGNTNTLSATSNYRLGFGSYSASSQTTGAIALTQITQMASNASLYFALDGKTQ